jgi:transposase
MIRRRISKAQRWQIIGIHTTGMSYKAIGRQMDYYYTVVSRLVRKHTQTNNVKDLPRSGRPRVTSDRDDRALKRLARRMPFATSPELKQHWLPNIRLSTRTVRNRLKSVGLKSRRVIKRPLLVDRHRRTRLAWCLARRGWNLRTWRKIHWSDESRFLFHVTDGPDEGLETQTYSLYPREHPANCPLRWRLSNGLGVYLSWLQAGFSHHTRQPNWWSVHQRRLAASCCPHFGNHPLATRPVYMDDNASLIVQDQ